MTVLTHLPSEGELTQGWAANRTAGVVANWEGSVVEQLVAAHGNYQPYGHDGWDIGSTMNTPVVAAGPGVVAFSGWGSDMPYEICIKYGFTTVQADKWASGLIVILDHGGFATYTAHMNRTDMDHRVGQWIAGGTLLGLSGTSGRSGGPHVHFSVIDLPVNYSDGLYSRRNPMDYYASNPFEQQAEEDFLSNAQYEDLKKRIGWLSAILTTGYRLGGKYFYGVMPVIRETQKRVSTANSRLNLVIEALEQLPQDVLWGVTVSRDGKRIPVIQEIADIKTMELENDETLDQIQESLAKLELPQLEDLGELPKEAPSEQA